MKRAATQPFTAGIVALTLSVFAWLMGPAQSTVAAVFEQREFPDPVTRARYLDIIDELRCLVCQNQNIADSDADLAADLRAKVFELLLAGRSDTEIMDFMVQRYGDFVLYRPPLKAVTAGLWIGPGLMLALGLYVLWRHLRGRSMTQAPLGPADRARVEELVADRPHEQG